MRKADIPQLALELRRLGDLVAQHGERLYDFTHDLAPGTTPSDGGRALYAALAEALARLAKDVDTYGVYLLDKPGVQDAIEQVHRAAQGLSLEINYLLPLERHIGDLPRIEQALSAARPTGSYTDNAGTIVYTAFDRNDQVIYVGITDDLFARMSAHRRGSRWWRHMARLTWEEWPDRDAALRKELTLIRRWRPPYNKAGNPDVKENR